MCAIAGLYAFSPPADRAALRTADPMAERGPDGMGEWFSETAAWHSATAADAQSFVITGHSWSTQ